MLAGCQSASKQEPTKNEQSSPPKIEHEQTLTLIDFFPKNPVEKYFIGIGNEFAQYTETIYAKDRIYYPATIDNGGTRVLRIYKVTENVISIVYEQPEFYDEKIPPLSTLEQSFQDKPLLALPLEKGKKIGEWEIVNLSETVTVPFGKFTNVIVLEKTNQDGSINRQYWAKNYGKVKDEYFFENENGDRYEVNSELQSIK